MKRRTSVAMALAGLAALVLPLLAAAQVAPAAAATGLGARVSAIIERFPAENAAARDALCAGIIELGPAAIVEACARVLPPGAGNDAKARFAVNGLAVYATRPGAEAERALFVRALWTALAGNPDKQVAAFLLSQVQLAGRAESVKPLARYLADVTLAGPASAALQTIGGPEAARALLKALENAPGTALVALVDALGAMRSREAVKKLLALTGSGDETLRRAARSALAEIGDPAAGPVLSTVRVTSSQAERAEVPGPLPPFRPPPPGNGPDDRGLERGPIDARRLRRAGGEPGRRGRPVPHRLDPRRQGPARSRRRGRQPRARAPGGGPGGRRDARSGRGDGPLGGKERGFGTGSPGRDRRDARTARRRDRPALRPGVPAQPRRDRPPGRHTGGGPPRRQSGRSGPRRAHRHGR